MGEQLFVTINLDRGTITPLKKYYVWFDLPPHNYTPYVMKTSWGDKLLITINCWKTLNGGKAKGGTVILHFDISFGV